MKIILKIFLWFFALVGIYSLAVSAVAIKQDINEQAEEAARSLRSRIEQTRSDPTVPARIDLRVEPIDISDVPVKNLMEMATDPCSTYTLSSAYGFQTSTACVVGRKPTTTPIYYEEIAYRDSDSLRQLSYHDRWISQIQFSSKRSFVGFYYRSSDWGDFSLVIMDLKTKRLKEIYRGNFRSAGWKWDGDDTIVIFYNCGTGCRSNKVIQINERIFTAGFKPESLNDTSDWQVRFAQGGYSPDGKYEGFSDEGYPTAPDNYFILRITERVGDKLIKEYRGSRLDYHWGWTPENTIKVWHYCGEGCKTFKIVQVK